MPIKHSYTTPNAKHETLDRLYEHGGTSTEQNIELHIEPETVELQQNHCISHDVMNTN